MWEIRLVETNSFLKYGLRLALAIVIVVLGLGVKRYLTAQAESQTPGEPPVTIPYLSVDEVRYTTVDGTITASGRVVSANPVQVITEVQGRILDGDVALRTGVSFRRGQLLFAVDDTEARLNLNASRSRFMTTVAGLLPDLAIDFPEAATTWQNYLGALDPERTLPDLPVLVDDRLKTFLASRGVLDQFYSIRSAEARLAKYRVTAPFDGSFTQVMYRTGGVANPGQPIAAISPAGALEIEVPLSPENAAWVEPGTEVIIRSAEGSATAPGRVARVSEVISPVTQSVNIYVTVGGRPDWIFEGAYFDVELDARPIEGYELNRSALLPDDRVLVIRDSVLYEEGVEVVRKDAEKVVFRGPAEGEWVVTQPTFNVYPGQRVAPVPADGEQSGG